MVVSSWIFHGQTGISTTPLSLEGAGLLPPWLLVGLGRRLAYSEAVFWWTSTTAKWIRHKSLWLMKLIFDKVSYWLDFGSGKSVICTVIPLCWNTDTVLNPWFSTASFENPSQGLRSELMKRPALYFYVTVIERVMLGWFPSYLTAFVQRVWSLWVCSTCQAKPRASSNT